MLLQHMQRHSELAIEDEPQLNLLLWQHLHSGENRQTPSGHRARGSPRKHSIPSSPVHHRPPDRREGDSHPQTAGLYVHDSVNY